MSSSRIVPRQANARAAWSALLLACLTLLVNFWAWSLISPMASQYVTELALDPLQAGVLVALPVIVGSVGRIFLGVLTDRYGGRNMFSLVCLLAAIPVTALALSATYSQLAVASIFLGISGATFAIGVPFVNAWFPPENRGLALGLYSMGNAGTAVSGFLTPRIAEAVGRPQAYLVVAGLLVCVSVVCMLVGKNAPGWKPAEGALMYQFKRAAGIRLTWDLSLLYMVTFGAFVAFGVYLPVLLKAAYGLTLTDSAARAAGFVLLATLARPFGGWLSDRVGGYNVIRAVLVAVPVLATYVSYQPSLQISTTVAFLSLAVVLGCGNGAIFAMLGRLAKPDLVGSMTGIIGAFGGLGGFVPPLVLGFTYQKTNSYSLALVLLAATALVVLAYMSTRFKLYKYRARC